MPTPFDHSSYTERAAMLVTSLASPDERMVPVLVRHVHADLPIGARYSGDMAPRSHGKARTPKAAIRRYSARSP